MDNLILNVLVIEDDLCLSALIEQTLKSVAKNVNLIWTTSAEDAERELETNKNIQLILADYALEGKATGMDLWRTCLEKYPDIPFIVLSGLGVDAFFKLVGENEVCPPFLPKPFYVGECRQLIASLVDAKDIQGTDHKRAYS